MNIGEKLKDLRLKNKKTLREQSIILGVSLNSVYRWEHSLAVPRKSILRKIADIYNVPLEWFLQENAEENKDEYESGAIPPENNIERQLLRMFRKLSENNQYKILGYVERVCVEDMNKKMN